ncbi:MAG: helix-turn-helix transcriptional regulator [Clostridia bacterium]|nr:helix-turn-helix transcriptional regulator [Clostridia bacterium]
MKLFDAEALGARITRKRQELGMLQKEFAKSVGLSVSFYGHIERGTRVPSLPTLVLIANRLHVGTDVLLRDSLDTPFLPKRSFTDRELGLLRQYMEDHGNPVDDWFDAKGEE